MFGEPLEMMPHLHLKTYGCCKLPSENLHLKAISIFRVQLVPHGRLEPLQLQPRLYWPVTWPLPWKF